MLLHTLLVSVSWWLRIHKKGGRWWKHGHAILVTCFFMFFHFVGLFRSSWFFKFCCCMIFVVIQFYDRYTIQMINWAVPSVPKWNSSFFALGRAEWQHFLESLPSFPCGHKKLAVTSYIVWWEYNRRTGSAGRSGQDKWTVGDVKAISAARLGIAPALIGPTYLILWGTLWRSFGWSCSKVARCNLSHFDHSTWHKA